MAAALSSDAGAQAANLALGMGSNAADAISLAAELGEELPFISPVLKTLTAIREKVETVKSNREELKALEVRCTYITACVIVKFKENPRTEIDLTPLEGCVKTVGEVVKRCGGRGRMSRVLKASSDKDEIAGLNALVDRAAGDLRLAGIAVIEEKTDDMKAMLERLSESQERMSKSQNVIVDHLQRSPAQLASVPKGTPTQKSWHVERRHVMESVFEALADGTTPRLVGLVGDSGAGKTTAASEIIRSTEMREAFSDGVVWLTVNDGAKSRLPVLMMQLARMVYEDIGRSVGSAPSESGDSVDYIKQHMEMGHGGKGLRCLVVADNVWEKEVVSKLRQTGMWVLISTRDGALVTASKGTAVGVDELSKADAKSVLRKAAELSPEVELPNDAVDLIELCGRVAMDLAFVGRWSTVRGRQDRTAWSDAAGKVRAEMAKIEGDSTKDIAENGRTKRRKAILHAGFEDLTIGSDDERVQRLYLSLAVMPDGHPFSVKDAAVLLYDRSPSADDEKSVIGVVEVLERWSVLRSADERVGKWRGPIGPVLHRGKYFFHDAHSGFARENLMERGHVRRLALARWVKHIASLDTLRSNGGYMVKGLWVAVEQLGADGWAKTRPYAKALADMDESDTLFWPAITAVARFQQLQDDLGGAMVTCRRILEACDAKIGLGGLRTDILCDLGVWLRQAGQLEQAETLLSLCLAIDEAKLGQEAVQVAYTLQHLGECIRQAGRLEEAVELLRRCLSIREAKLDPDSEQVAYTLQQLGECARQTGRLKEAEQLLRRCLSIKQAKLGPDDVQVAYTLQNLGECVREAGRLEEAEELLRRCLSISEAKLGPDDVQVAHTLYWLGQCVRQAGRLEKAEELLRRCLSISEAKLGPEDVQVAYTLQHLGVCLRQAGRLEEAEQLLRRCLSIEEARLGPEDVQVTYTLQHLGVCVHDAGRSEEAEQLLRRCLSIKEAKLGQEDEQVTYTLQHLGECARQAGRLEEAEQLLRRCLLIVEAKLGSEDEQVAYTLQQLGVCVREAGRQEEAEQLLRRCLSIKEVKLGPEDVQVAYTLQHLGVCVHDAGRLEEAEQLLRRCLAIKEAKLDSEEVQLAYTLYRLGACLCQAGRLVEAEELLRRCLNIEEAQPILKDVDIARTLHQLSLCVRKAGRPREAKEMLRRVLAIVEAKLSRPAADTSDGQVNKYSRQQEWLEKAKKRLKECLAIDEAELGCNRRDTDKGLQELGAFLREAGKLN
eukprot:g17346.t1